MVRCCAWAVMVIAAGFGSLIEAADPPWKAGFARRDITPQQPVFLAGYAARDRPLDGVESPLWVKAMALQDADGQRAVVVTCDIIGFPRQVAQRICQQIQDASNLARQDLLLSASHVHTGPVLVLEVEQRPPQVTDEQIQRQIAYTQRLIDLTVEAALEALDAMTPARLRYGFGFAPFVMNRRDWRPEMGTNGFNPSGYADRSVPVLRVEDADGALRGVLFGAAAHNTTLTGKDFFVSGDYAGYAQQHIEQQHPDAQAMFIAGCAGSANPHPRGTLEYAKQHGSTLGSEVCDVLESDLPAVQGPLRTRFGSTQLPLRLPPSRAEIHDALTARSSWQRQVAAEMLRVLESGDPFAAQFEYELSVWQFGDDLTLVGLSGEVVGEFVPLIQAALGRDSLWTAAYCHNVAGYIPTAQVLREGGYETRGLYADRPGIFTADAERRLVAKVRRMAKDAGRVSTEQK